MTRAGPRACKRDANHAAVLAGAYGRDVLDLAAYGCPVDAAVWISGNLWMMVDVKSSAKASLTAWQREHEAQVAFVCDPQALADAVGVAARRLRPVPDAVDVVRAAVSRTSVNGAEEVANG